MKNLILLSAFALIAFPLFAQQQINSTSPFKQSLSHHSCMANDVFVEQQHQTFLPDEMYSFFKADQTNELVIRKDSVIIQTKSNTLKQKYSWDDAGNLASELTQILYSGSWVNERLSTYTYDENGNMLTELRQLWQGEAWANDAVYTSTYDEHGNMLTIQYQYWDGEVLVNYWIVIYTYDINDNMLTQIAQDWENGVWVNFSGLTNTYNIFGEIETSLGQHWENGAWVDDEILFFTYNSNGQLLSAYRMTNIFGEWMNTFMNSYTFDIYGYMDSLLIQDWDNLNGTWVNSWLSTRINDINGNWLTETRQLWIEGAWENIFNYSRTFDSEENLIEETRQGWANDEWVNNKKATYDFLPGHVNANAFDWDGSNWIASVAGAPLTIFMGGEWLLNEFAVTLDFFYTDITGIEEQNANTENEAIHCYPNPASNQINIEINPAWQTKNCLIELFNQSGQRVKSMEILPNSESSASINVEEVPPGLYLLKFTSGKLTSTRKMIISR
jgi:hypothetical protein